MGGSAHAASHRRGHHARVNPTLVVPHALDSAVCLFGEANGGGPCCRAGAAAKLLYTVVHEEIGRLHVLPPLKPLLRQGLPVEAGEFGYVAENEGKTGVDTRNI